MMRKFVLSVLLAGLMGAGWALADSKTIIIKAHIPSSQGLSVNVSRISTSTGQWSSASQIDFGDLSYNSNLGIFLPDCYYAVDVGVLSNATNWTIQYTADSIDGPNSSKLDDHVVVSFVKQTNNQGEQLEKTVYSKAKSRSFSKGDLAGGWLRIYYGIATGDPSTDPAGAKPITTNVPSGYYQGQITISLTVS